MGSERTFSDVVRQHHRRMDLGRLRKNPELGPPHSRSSHQADVIDSGFTGLFKTIRFKLFNIKLHLKFLVFFHKFYQKLNS